MRHFVASALVVGCATAGVAGFQGRAGGAAVSPPVKACSLLPKALVAKYWSGNKKVFEVLTPMEEAVGARGSSCGYGTIELQVDAFANDRITDVFKGWEPVSGVGDRAYFRNNSNRFAEIVVVSGSHNMTIQLDVPDGKTGEARKPDVIALAKEILPNLK
jgi:hypothetical protein